MTPGEVLLTPKIEHADSVDLRRFLAVNSWQARSTQGRRAPFPIWISLSLFSNWDFSKCFHHPEGRATDIFRNETPCQIFCVTA